jgi:hypothetical protein
MQEEGKKIEAANADLKIRRNARLRELYTREAETFEQELHAMGLAISKDRH